MVCLSLLILCTLALTSMQTPAFATVDTDADTILESPDVLTISGIRGQATTTIPLPTDAVPVLFAAVVTSSYTRPGELIVTLGGRDIAPVDALTGGDVLALMSTEDLDDENRLQVGLRIALGDDDERCFDQTGVAAVLDDIKIAYEVPIAAPESVADFLTGSPRSVTVSVPPDSAPQLHEAALNTVTVMAKTFPRPTEVGLQVEAPIPANPSLDRLVEVTESAESKVEVVDGILKITGPADTLTSAARSLASDSVAVLGEPTAGEPRATIAETIPSLSRSLADLGKANPALAGVGIVESTFGISQSDFGRPVNQMTISLVGAVTPVQGGEGRVNLLWNDELIDSVPMTNESDFAMSVTVSGAEVRRDNSVTIQLEYLPRGGECTLDGLPARLDIDTQASTITASAGSSVTGFEMFPQALTTTTPVAFGSQQSADESAAQAGQILASLQRLTGQADQSRAASLGGLCLRLEAWRGRGYRRR